MPIEHELLRRRAREFRPRRPDGIPGLVAGAHRDPVLGFWLTVESTLLAPVPAREERGWTLWSLVSVVDRGAAAYHPPWGAVQWHWPSRRVARMVTLDERADLADLRAAARSAPVSAWRVGMDFSRDRRDATLARVETTLGAPDPDLAGLAPSYAGLLPEASYPLYHALAPGSADWLHPAAPPRQAASGPVVAPRPASPDTAAHSTPAARLSTWLRAARKLGERLGSDHAAADLDELARGRGAPFRLAVAGTGRSPYALVDRMLDAPVLPAADDLPPVVLAAGPERRLELEAPDGTVERVALEPVAWERARGSGPVRVVLDDAVLKAVDGELVVVGVDDPGAGRTLAGCDAVALVTRATAGLGMAERELLERHVTGRHVPRVTVVVTQLDRIDPEERADVVDYISARARGLRVPVSVPADDDGAADAILALADPAGREADRTLRLTSRLADHVASLGEQARRRQAQAETEAAARAEAGRAAERELDGQLLDWRSLRNELQQRANANVAELRASLLSYRADLLDRLMFELKRSRDPRQWWEEELGYRLRRDLEATVRRYESQLERNVTADLEWLDGRTRALFDRTVARPPGARAAVCPEESPLNRIDAPNLSRYRLGVRVAPAVAGLLGVLFIPGGIIAMGLASAAALAAGELKLQGMVPEQRDLVAAELPGALDRAINGVSDELSDRINRVYSEFLDEAERTQQAWRDAELAAIHEAARVPDSPWPQLVSDVRALHDELRAAPDTTGGGR